MLTPVLLSTNHSCYFNCWFIRRFRYRVVGGGCAGQSSGASPSRVACALLQVDPDFRDSLKRAGLTRDTYG